MCEDQWGELWLSIIELSTLSKLGCVTIGMQRLCQVSSQHEYNRSIPSPHLVNTIYLSQSPNKPRDSFVASTPDALPFSINLCLLLSAFSLTRMSSTPRVNPWYWRKVVNTLARAVRRYPATTPPYNWEIKHLRVISMSRQKA